MCLLPVLLLLLLLLLSSPALPLCTPPLPPSATFLCLTPLPHPSATFLCLTPLQPSSASPLCLIPLHTQLLSRATPTTRLLGASTSIAPLPHPSASSLCNLPLPHPLRHTLNLAHTAIVPSHSRHCVPWGFYFYSPMNNFLSGSFQPTLSELHNAASASPPNPLRATQRAMPVYDR